MAPTARERAAIGQSIIAIAETIRTNNYDLPSKDLEESCRWAIIDVINFYLESMPNLYTGAECLRLTDKLLEDVDEWFTDTINTDDDWDW